MVALVAVACEDADLDLCPRLVFVGSAALAYGDEEEAALQSTMCKTVIAAMARRTTRLARCNTNGALAMVGGRQGVWRALLYA